MDILKSSYLYFVNYFIGTVHFYFPNLNPKNKPRLIVLFKLRSRSLGVSDARLLTPLSFIISVCEAIIPCGVNSGVMS